MAKQQVALAAAREIPNVDIHRVPPELEAIRELPGSGDN
jgi:hypothetical protein